MMMMMMLWWHELTFWLILTYFTGSTFGSVSGLKGAYTVQLPTSLYKNTVNCACWNAFKWPFIRFRRVKKAWVVVLFGCHPITKVENFLKFSKVSGTSGQENFRLGGWEMWPCDNVGHWFHRFGWYFHVKVESNEALNDLIPYRHAII